jgi:uncharacterized protein YbjT (DUF2867 family)
MTTTLVTGGTGTLGRVLVPRLSALGHDVRVLSRRPKPSPSGPAGAHGWVTGDLRSGEGVDAAVAGADVIAHCATSQRGEQAAAANLIAAASRATGPHLVYISIVGVDRVSMSYYKHKLATENLISGSGLPWTILRATQFHDLILTFCQTLAKLPVMPVAAGVSFQPVDVREVAARLAELATGPPARRVPDVAGPQVRPMTDLARSYLKASGRHRPLLPVRLPGATFAGLRRGGLLAPGRAVGRVTFEEFLGERFGTTGADGGRSR